MIQTSCGSASASCRKRASLARMPASARSRSRARSRNPIDAAESARTTSLASRREPCFGSTVSPRPKVAAFSVSALIERAICAPTV